MPPHAPTRRWSIVEARNGTNHNPTRIQEIWGRWYRMPATVSVLGLLSVALLIWSKQIHERQQTHFAFANVIMDLRIRVATSHLWLEEAIHGVSNRGEMARASSDLREATRLSEVLLNGGSSEDGLLAPPLKDPELRRRAEDLRRLLSEWGMLTRERMRRPEAGLEGSPLESRGDGIFDELQGKAAELENIFERDQASDIIDSRRLFYGLLLAWSSILVASTTVLLRRERRRRDAEEALQSGKDELEKRVAERTSQLRSVNDQLSLELGERQKTEEALRESAARLRDLSARLLTAQETERRRISTELHDALGPTLILMKFRFGLIARELGEGQSTAREECEALSGFIDQTIEDVRRLSRDLRPSVLEELGLSAALRGLVDNCSGNGHTVVGSIGDVDALVSRNAQVILYRIIQQALTNAEKHAHAKHVSLSVERQGDRLSFVVEDDGEGFEVDEALMRSPGERGLGLATMQERAWMLGGSLSVWSEKGKGTRVTLGVPVPNREA